MNKTLRKGTLSVLFALAAAGSAWADKKVDYEKTYNVVRAIELKNEENLVEAKKYLDEELKEHPDNGFACFWLAVVQYKQDNNGEALSSVNKALRLIPKKSDLYPQCYELRAYIYKDLGEKEKTLEDYDNMIKVSPDARSYMSRGSYLLSSEEYEKANADFEKAAELEPGSAWAYLSSGICLRNLERYDEALEQMNYAIKLNPKESFLLSHRSYCQIKRGKFAEAVDDALTAIGMDRDDLAVENLNILADSAFALLDFKLKVEQKADPSNPIWPFLRGRVCYRVHRYEEAMEIYRYTEKQYNLEGALTEQITSCQMALCDYAGALSLIDEALVQDSTNVSLLNTKAECFYQLDRPEEAIATMTRILAFSPRNGYAYYRRGWFKELVGDCAGAVEDYSVAILIDPEASRYYVNRGKSYRSLGQEDLARKDFETVVNRDSADYSSLSLCYAYVELGEYDRARSVIDSIMTKDARNEYYNAACVYSLMDEPEKALEYLRLAFEDGFYRFVHMERDRDLDNIRQLPEFQSLVAVYKSKLEERLGIELDNVGDGEDAEYVTEVVEVPFTHEGGVTKVKCTINDLPLHFVFDTGAADVTISLVEANFMWKNGYLSEKDITGKQYYGTADGTLSVGMTIVLRKVNFGGLELDNVEASIVLNQRAPLLLGQTVFKRLGTIEIDNERDVLKITQKKRK